MEPTLKATEKNFWTSEVLFRILIGLGVVFVATVCIVGNLQWEHPFTERGKTFGWINLVGMAVGWVLGAHAVRNLKSPKLSYRLIALMVLSIATLKVMDILVGDGDDYVGVIIAFALWFTILFELRKLPSATKRGIT